MEKYNEYKDSGIEWLGEIPEHWEIRRIKDIATVKTGSKNTEDKVSEGNYPFFVRSQNVERINSYSFDGEAILTAGDGVGVGKVFHHYIGKFETHQRVYRISHFNKHDGRFLFNYLKRNLAKEVLKFNVKSTVDSLRMPMFLNFNVAFPPLKEQTQIANYLDAKTILIDKKIKLLKQKIKHYKAYRKTLINKTVTKGLNDDISGWVKFRLKDLGFLYSGLSGKSGDDFNQDDNPNNKGFIPFTNIANNTYLKKKQLGTVVINDNEKQNQVKKNDIFFLMSSEGYEDIGKSAVLIEDLKETYLNSFCKGFRLTNKNSDASFINYLLLSDTYRQQMLVEGKGFTRINLKMEKVNNFSILIPSTKKEQQQIVAYLDAKTTIIDNIVNNIETQITTLKELRKTLINEVVTGKVKVTA